MMQIHTISLCWFTHTCELCFKWYCQCVPTRMTCFWTLCNGTQTVSSVLMMYSRGKLIKWIKYWWIYDGCVPQAWTWVLGQLGQIQQCGGQMVWWILHSQLCLWNTEVSCSIHLHSAVPPVHTHKSNLDFFFLHTASSIFTQVRLFRIWPKSWTRLVELDFYS